MNNRRKPADFEARLIESFSKHVKSYDRHAQLQKTMAERLASMVPENLSGTVIELGCGTGVFTRHLLTRPIRKLILNDIAPAMIEHLRDHLRLPPQTQTIIGNAEHIRFEAADLIAANAVFQWFHSHQNTLTGLAGSLKKNGTLIFSTFGPGTLQEFRETASLESPANLKSFDQWKNIIARAGLTLGKSYSEVRKTFSSSTLTLIRNLQQIGAAPLPMMKPGSLRRLIRTYDENYATGQGVYATWEILFFSASRP